MFLGAGTRVGVVWGMPGEFEKSSQSQAPRTGDKGTEAFASQPGAEVAGPVAGLQ